MYGCLMITIDCSAEEQQYHSIIYICSKPKRKNPPHRLDLYGTWDPWQDLSSVDSPKWLCETQDLIHEELMPVLRTPEQHERDIILVTDHARSYSQLDASLPVVFLQSLLHLLPRKNDCVKGLWLELPKTPTRRKAYILSPEVRK